MNDSQAYSRYVTAIRYLRVLIRSIVYIVSQSQSFFPQNSNVWETQGFLQINKGSKDSSPSRNVFYLHYTVRRVPD